MEGITPHKVTGLRGLAIERASMLAVERAQKEPGEAPLFIKVGMGLAGHLALDVSEGMEWAKMAVAVMRGASDYNPATHGTTDDEVADYILTKVRAKRSNQLADS